MKRTLTYSLFDAIAIARRQPKRPIFCAVDVETDGLGGPLLSVQYCLESLDVAGISRPRPRPTTRAGRAVKRKRIGACAKAVHDRDALAKIALDIDVYTTLTHKDPVASWLDVFFALPTPHIWYAHNLSYDARYLLPPLVARAKVAGCSVEVMSRTGEDVLEIRVTTSDESSKFVLRDSLAIYPHSLAEFAEQFADPQLQKLVGAIDFDGGERFDPANLAHLEYAKRDVVSLVSALRGHYNDTKKTFGVAPSLTVSATAMHAWQSTMTPGVHVLCAKDDLAEKICRAASYGGAVFLTSVAVHRDAITLDVNSSYPASLIEQPMPSGRPIFVRTRDRNRLGIYRVVVRVPESLRIVPIPCRDARGALAWRRGIIETICTSVDLDTAEAYGCEIMQIHSGIEWSDVTTGLFNDVIARCMRVRTQYKGQPIEQVAKLIQNSIVGKFGSMRQRWEVSDILYHDSILMPEIPGLYARRVYAESLKCRPDYFAFITAHARRRLFRAAQAVGVEHVIYGDTDSLTLGPGADLTKLDIDQRRYGAWKIEKKWQEFRAIAPKVYAGRLESGEFAGAIKGLPRGKHQKKMLEELFFSGRTSVEYQQLANFLYSATCGKMRSPAELVERKSSSLSSSRNFVLDRKTKIVQATFTDQNLLEIQQHQNKQLLADASTGDRK